jgi:hypothetical protein
MSYASKSGRARTNPQYPQAFAICDRCGFLYNHVDLKWQFEWRGPTLQNIRFLVCDDCLDVPQENVRAIAIPPDPLPIVNARIQDYIGASTSPPNVVGPPLGLEPYAIVPAFEKTLYGLPIAFLSVFSTGTAQVNVTCAAAHGLVTNDQISVSGLTSNVACGMFSVVVTGAMSFNYITASAVPSGSLLAPNVVMVTVLVGLPYNQATIPLP